MANFGTAVTSSSPDQDTSHRAGAAIAIGDVVYLDGVTWKLALSTGLATLGTIGISRDMGVALDTAISGGAITVLLSGLLENCSSLLAGGIYCVSGAAGGAIIASASVTEDTLYMCVVGVARSTTAADIRPINPGVIVNLA